MRDHEYSIIGHSRANVGRFLGTGAAIIASSATAAGIGLSKFAAATGLPEWTQHVVLPISAGIAYALVHWAFNRYGWRCLTWVSQIPDIKGMWNCTGKTMNDDGSVRFEWTAEVTISQNWEKIRVRLQTSQSASNSVSAALIPEPDGCWMLMYSYRNEPRAGEPDLNPHIGYCEMRFHSGLAEADGDYFNARGRGTFGRMHFTRKKA